LMSIKVN